jgi:hypothetical protein
MLAPDRDTDIFPFQHTKDISLMVFGFPDFLCSCKVQVRVVVEQRKEIRSYGPRCQLIIGVQIFKVAIGLEGFPDTKKCFHETSAWRPDKNAVQLKK